MNRLLFGALAAAILSTAWGFLPDPGLHTASYAAIKLGFLGLATLAIAVASASLPAVRLNCIDLALGSVFGLSLLSTAANSRNFQASAAILALDLAGWICFAAASRLEFSQREALARVIVLAAGGIAFLAVIEMLGVRLPWSSIRRPVSAIGHRNFVAAYLAISFPLAVREGVFGSRKVWGLVAAGLCLVVVIAARCRSAWFGIFAAALPMVGLVAGSFGASGVGAGRRRGRGLLVFAGGAALIVGLVAVLAMARFPGLEWRGSAPFAASFRGLFDWERGSASRRFDHYRIAAAAAAENIWLGVGPHQWSPAVARYAHVVPGGRAQPFTGELTPNSEVARRVAELGLPAAGILGAVFVLLMVGGARASRGAEVSQRAFLIACMAALAAAAINGLADAPLYRPETMVLIAVVAGCLRPPREVIDRPGWVSRSGVFAAGFAVSASTILQAGAAVIVLLFGVAGTPWALSWYAGPRGVEKYARALATAGRCADAEPWLRRARDWAPERVGLIRLQADCELRAGRVEEAAALRREAERLEAQVPRD